MDFLVAAHKIEDCLWRQNVAGLGGVADFAAEIAALEGGDIQMVEDGFDVRTYRGW